DETSDPANREKSPADVGRGSGARVVADRKPLVRKSEEDLDRRHEARETKGVDLRAGDARAPRFRGAVRLGDRMAHRRSPDPRKPSGELPRGAAGRVGLSLGAVVDDLPAPDVLRGDLGKALEEDRGEREVADGEDPDATRPRRLVDRGEVFLAQARRADDG